MISRHQVSPAGLVHMGRLPLSSWDEHWGAAPLHSFRRSFLSPPRKPECRRVSRTQGARHIRLSPSRHCKANTGHYWPGGPRGTSRLCCIIAQQWNSGIN